MCEKLLNVDAFFNAYENGQEFGRQIAEYLGLPTCLIRAEIIITADQPVIIKCEYYEPLITDKGKEFIAKLAEYELHKIEKI